MAGPITDAHKLAYVKNVELAVQQTKSKFEQAFTYQDSLKGRVACMLELIGATEAILDGARGGDTPNIDATIEPVWCKPRQIEWGKLIEKEDAIKALTDYQSQFVQAGAAAIVRGRDKIFAQAIFGNRLIGQDAATEAAYDPTNKVVAVDVGAGSATGMNLAKIERAKRYLRAFEVNFDAEELWGALNAQQMEELYYDIIANATTPQGKTAVLDATTKIVHAVAGINFVHSEQLPAHDGSTYAAAIWCKSGMYYGDFDPLKVSAEPNPAKKYRIHPYMENWFGATRAEDKKVIKILTKI
ncbi:MAG TPA: phage capsid protein [Burkholderiaceae bacterium]|nr:phage capsid protein [Burkholderiaceae bacterium]